jgi:hypothetical protein
VTGGTGRENRRGWLKEKIRSYKDLRVYQAAMDAALSSRDGRGDADF